MAESNFAPNGRAIATRVNLEVKDSYRLGDPLPQRIVIMRALPGLGDLLCAVPAFRALRAALPQTHITLIGLPWAQQFAARFREYVDGFLEFPGYPGIPERPPAVGQLPAFFARTQQMRFDLALQMHGSGIVSNPFTILLGARRTAGFYLPGQYCPDPDTFLPYPEDEPEVWRHLRLIEFLGIPLRGQDLDFPIGEEDVSALRAVDEVGELRPGGYICLHPGARETARRWSPEKFAAVADILAGYGYRIVLTGTQQEADLTQAVARAMGSPHINLAGRTTLGALAVLLRDARLLISNDTGVSHLAAALCVPSVVIFTASDPLRWAPVDRQQHRPVVTPAPLQPTVVEVLRQAEDLLSQAASPEAAYAA